MTATSPSPWRFVPVTFVVARFCLGPALFADAWGGQPGWEFVLGATLAFLSDVFDGVIARRIGASTEALREADSWVDTWYYLWIGAAIWHVHQSVILDWARPLALVAGSQLLCWVVDFAKYRRFATYHQLSAKLWGITLFALTVSLFGYHYAGWCMGLMIVAGTLSHLEGIAMTLVLPRWTYDVAGIWHALALRPGQLAEAAEAA